MTHLLVNKNRQPEWGATEERDWAIGAPLLPYGFLLTQAAMTMGPENPNTLLHTTDCLDSRRTTAIKSNQEGGSNKTNC